MLFANGFISILGFCYALILIKDSVELNEKYILLHDGYVAIVLVGALFIQRGIIMRFTIIYSFLLIIMLGVICALINGSAAKYFEELSHMKYN